MLKEIDQTKPQKDVYRLSNNPAPKIESRRIRINYRWRKAKDDMVASVPKSSKRPRILSRSDRIAAKLHSWIRPEGGTAVETENQPVEAIPISKRLTKKAI